MLRFVLLIAGLLLHTCSLTIQAQNPDSVIPFELAYKRVYHTVRLQSHAPEIDGILDDACWESDGLWSVNFIQNTPIERALPTFPTRIKILYDDKNIYFALRAWDPEPEKINRFIGNRDDNSVGDLISVCFDTYHDYRAGTEFNINAGGNKTDLIVTDNLSINLSWNAVWEGKTAVNDSSWTVEFRIPLNQLRYNHNDTGMVWGLHVRRIVRRIQETDQWSLIPRKNSGHVYSFGTLNGLKGLKKPRLLEFLPYSVGKLVLEPEIQGNPFATGSRWNGTIGTDAKTGIRDFTLDVTVNPDFGQVEADPSVMNLTALETFYDEKRPFFLEGKHIFDFSADDNLMFYSRRIGHVPSYQPPDGSNGNFASVPEYTSIMDAVKLSGTTPKGYSVGILQSLTQQEFARVSQQGNENLVTAEPAANFLVARLQRVANKGNTQAGAMITSTNRFIHDNHLGFLVRNAFTGGIDLLQYSRNRDYFFDFRGMFSHVNGEPEAILALQRNPLHYFQRPDAANYLGVDSARTSMKGTGGHLYFGRQGNRKLVFSERIYWWSPSFDLNDAGYLLMADLIENITRVAYRQTEPGKVLRNYSLALNQSNAWNFGGYNTHHNAGAEFTGVFQNRSEVSLHVQFVWKDLATRLLRGGPALRTEPFWQHSVVLNTDKSSRLYFRIQSNSLIGTDGVTRQFMIEPGINLRIGNRLYALTEFGYIRNVDANMYVAQAKGSDEIQYVLGRIKQQTYQMEFRLNFNLTPDFSVQYYGSPFISSGMYSHFKRTADTRSAKEQNRTHVFASNEISFDAASNQYAVIESGNDYRFDNPDFSFHEFRSNLVVRWEYRPGSTLYLVWGMNALNRDNSWNASLSHHTRELLQAESTQVFIVKLNYWIGL